MDPLNPCINAQFAQRSDVLFKSRRWFQILEESTRMYLAHALVLTAPLLQPLGLLYGGVYLTLAVFAWLNEPARLQSLLSMVGSMGGLVLVGLLFLATMALFFWGFWRYVVYFAALNRTAHSVMNNAPVTVKADYEAILAQKKSFLWLLNGLIAIQLIALIPCMLLAAIPALLLAFLGFSSAWVDTVVSGILSLGLLVCYTWFSMGFQVIAFETAPVTITGVLRRSASLIQGHYWQTGLLLLFFGMMTCLLVPALIVPLLRLTPLMDWLDAGHLSLLQIYLTHLKETPELVMVLDMLKLDEQVLACQGSDLVLSSLISALLLPWGTIAHAMLYGHITHMRQEIQRAPDQVEQAA